MTDHPEIAVLSYHGWEIDPERLVSDVRSLREQGWRDISLEELHQLLSRTSSKAGRYFHVTSDDGTEGDAEFIRALRTVNCPATMFICLGRMTDAAKTVYASLRGASDIAIGDHTFGHQRTFHYRHVVGFSCSAEPLVSSPEQLGITEGAPVLMYGPDLERPAFHPREGVNEVCRSAAAAHRPHNKSRALPARWSGHRSASTGWGNCAFAAITRIVARGKPASGPHWPKGTPGCASFLGRTRLRSRIHGGGTALLLKPPFAAWVIP